MNKKVIIGIGVAVVVLIVLIIAIAVPLSLKNDGKTDTSGLPPLERAKIILGRVPLVDGHNDLAYQYRNRVKNQVYSIDLRKDVNSQPAWEDKTDGIPGQTDIPKLRKGMLGAQFWACYASCNISTTDAVRVSLDQLDTIKKFVKKYPDDFKWVTSAQGIWDAFNEGKIGSMVGLEGGHSIDSSLSTLRMFYDLGVRYMTVTHSCNTPWADNWKEDEDGNIHNGTFGGLTDFGKDVLLEMNRIGMLVDLSHVSYQTMVMALGLVKAPVIYSHSSAWEICNHARNVRDDVLDLVKENGGVVMVNFYDVYIQCDESKNATISTVADHIEHIKNKIGVDYVGIGGDYDGVPTLPLGLEDVSTYPDLFAELARRNWSDEEMEKLAGLNLIRAFTKAEQVRDELMVSENPRENLIPEEEIPEEYDQCRPDF